MFDPGNPVCREAIHYPAGREEFRKLLDAAAKEGQEQVGGQSECLACVERLIHVPIDRSACATVEAFVRHFVAESASERPPKVG